MLAGLLALLGAASARAQVQTLYSTPGSPSWRDNYTGGSGCRFTVGSSNVVVSHLGYFSTNTVSGLAVSHYVGIYSSSAQLLAQVTVPAGMGADAYTNLFYWMPLDPPFLLSSNTTYYVAALPYSGDGDVWGDSFTATWNTFFVGGTAASTRATAYGPGSSTWPIPSFSTFGSGSTYCVEGLANLPIDYARAGVQSTNVAYSSGQTVFVAGFASGQTPITNQWWKAGSPNVLISTATNIYTFLNIPNATPASSGTYFMTASNALGGEQSANVSVSVTAYPVGISQQPTNTTVYANYPATFSITTTGTPPVYLQWSRNGAVISGATSNRYAFFTGFPANNGDIYTCLASNYLSPIAYTAASSNATLTVLPNQAFPQEILHGYNSGLGNNTYQGQQGGEFVVGNTPVLVTHLGYYAWPANCVTNNGVVTCMLATDHHVGIYNPAGVAIGGYVPLTALLGSVDVPAGSNPVLNGYMWMPLNPPLVLSNNTTYLLEGETKSDTDWGNSYVVPDLNPYLATSCSAIYGGNGWGSTPYLGGGYSGQMYSAPNMAILAYTNPTAYVTPASVTQVAGSPMTLTAYAEGQAPVTVQWYQNGTLLAGQTNLTLFKPFLQAADTGNYYVIATNTVTSLSATSTVASVTVSTANPPETLFVGAHPALSVSANASLTYQWFGNGTPINGATNPVYNFTVAAGSPTNFYCVATGASGSSTGVVSTVSIIPAPTAPYPSAVLAANPYGYWRLNEPDNGLGNNDDGVIANDYWGGNVGIYTNAALGQAGYSASTDPTETSAEFGADASADCDANSIGNVDFSAPTNTSVAFTIQAWVNAQSPGGGNAGIVSKGYFGGEEFSLDCGGPNKAFRFEVRGANAAAYNANSTLVANDGLWHHLTGVCDEPHSNVVLYIDGVLAGSASIPPRAGLCASNATIPMIIGSRPTSATSGGNNQFLGFVNEVAVYNYALTASNVDAEYAQADVPPLFTVAPPATVNTNDGSFISIPVSLVGTPPMGFQWQDTAQGTNVAVGVTNGPILNATLNVTVPLAWNGDNLQLTVTNAYGSTNIYVAFTVNPATPQITQDIQSQQVYIYQPVQFAAAASGTIPLSYQWTFNGSPIAGATNDTLTLNSAALTNAGNYQVVVTNRYGAISSSVAALTVGTPPAGSYAAAVLSPDLLLYYPLDDAASGYGMATNLGSLGEAYNGTYEGGYTTVAGPEGFSNFSATNQALALDGSSVDVVIPDLSSLTLTNCTIAAWVYDGGGQPDNDAIFFHRQTDVFGLASGNNILGGNDWVKYTWNDGSYDNYTGLVLPTNQWAFVAMVINPTNATIYMQNGAGMNSVSFTGAYPPAAWDGVSYIGWDTAGGASGRRWNGAIGDVMVFSQALSPAAVNALFAGNSAPVGPVTLNVARSGNQLTLSWPQGTLLQATNLAGPWVTNTASSPYTTTPTGAMMFYRIRVQ